MFRKKPKQPDLPAEWLIVGLGNPGPAYRGTRHNVGFDLIDLLAEKYKIELKTRQHQAVFGRGMIEGVCVVLVKPMTFMNLSGQAVSPLLRTNRLGPDKLVVIADELDLQPGDVKFSPKGGPGGHNGHRSIIQSLGTQEYARLKIGIGKPPEEGRDHVLDRFPPEERVTINEVLAKCALGIATTVTQGIERGIAEINSAR